MMFLTEVNGGVFSGEETPKLEFVRAIVIIINWLLHLTSPSFGLVRTPWSLSL